MTVYGLYYYDHEDGMEHLDTLYLNKTDAEEMAEAFQEEEEEENPEKAFYFYGYDLNAPRHPVWRVGTVEVREGI